jgi:DNA repair protein RadA/Sms
MILAVLDRKVGIAVGQYDVFINVAGGVRVEEPAMDLAIALALASSLRDRPVDGGLVAFGEIGLAGEVRGVDRVGARLAEAQAMGFKTAVVPSSAKPAGEPSGLEVVTVRTLSEAVDRFL